MTQVTKFSYLPSTLLPCATYNLLRKQNTTIKEKFGLNRLIEMFYLLDSRTPNDLAEAAKADKGLVCLKHRDCDIFFFNVLVEMFCRIHFLSDHEIFFIDNRFVL